MTIDELAQTVARRIDHERQARELMFHTRELIWELYHGDGLTARRIEQDTIQLLTAAPYYFAPAQIRGKGLGEDAIRKAVGRRPKV